MRTLLRRFFPPLLLCCCLAVHAQDVQPLKKTLHQLLKQQVDSLHIPGAVLQVQYRGELIVNAATGFAERFDSTGSLLKRPVKMTKNHLFDIASLTKVVATTTAIMKLTDMKAVHPDDPLSKFIPAFNTGEKKQITIRHLLTHTAGLYEWYPLYYFTSSREQTYKLIASLPLKYPVGKERHYSDLGFILLGQVVEVVSGQSLDRYVQAEIFQPLGMSSTMYKPAGRYRGPVAPTSFGNPYEYRMVRDSSLGFVYPEVVPDSWNGWRHYPLKAEVNDGNCWYACKGVNGAAGLFATAGDIQKLINLLLRATQPDEKKSLISAETIQLFLQQDAFKNGLGWMMDPANSFMKNAPAGSFGHTGFTGTSIAVVPSMQLSVVLLINRQQRGLLPAQEYFNLNPLRRQIFETIIHYLSPAQ